MRPLVSLIKSINNCRHISAKKLAGRIANRCIQTSANQHSDLVSCQLSSRAVLRLAGPDTANFLQGLVTNDVHQLMEETSAAVQYCMMLNVQGRVMYDLLLYKPPAASGPGASSETRVLIDLETCVKDELIKSLKRYKLRKKVDISDVTDECSVWARYNRDNSALSAETTSPGSPDGVYSFPDPRVPGFAHRVISTVGELQEDAESCGEDYRVHRYLWGVPEGVEDLPPGKCLPLESNLALMNGVNFNKGCYIGQELTARTYHTGVTRKRLLPIVLGGEADIEDGAKISTSKGRNAGKFRHRQGLHGLGLLRLAHIKDELSVGGVSLACSVPSWWPANALQADPTA